MSRTGFLLGLLLSSVVVFQGCIATLGDVGDSWKGAPVNDFIARAGVFTYGFYDQGFALTVHR